MHQDKIPQDALGWKLSAERQGVPWEELTPTDLTKMENEIEANDPDQQRTSSHREERLVRHSGNAAHRLQHNPLEKRYADMWRQKQGSELQEWRQKQDSGLLEYLMGDGATRGHVSERDELVAATVIQWLGSPVGQGFLRDVNSLPNA